MALEQTFTFRKTHPLPVMLPHPPSAWTTPYAAMAREDLLVWPTLDEVTQAAKAFLDPALAGDVDLVWSPETWTWGKPRAPIVESPRQASETVLICRDRRA